MNTSSHLTIGELYTRNQLRAKFAITDSSINNGVFRPQDHNSVWLFVTEHKSPDRIPYTDRLDGDELIWDGQRLGRTDKWIIEHVERGTELLVFYRERRDQYPNFGFCYEGIFEYVSHSGKFPTQFSLRRAKSLSEVVEQDIYASARLPVLVLQEGGVNYYITAHFERNPELRAAAIRIHGITCQVCGFNFEETYGVYGRDFIEVHHKTPISEMIQPEDVNPKADMAVVCSNCHAMIHRDIKHVLDIEHLQDSISHVRPSANG